MVIALKELKTELEADKHIIITCAVMKNVADELTSGGRDREVRE